MITNLRKRFETAINSELKEMLGDTKDLSVGHWFDLVDSQMTCGDEECDNFHPIITQARVFVTFYKAGEPPHSMSCYLHPWAPPKMIKKGVHAIVDHYRLSEMDAQLEGISLDFSSIDPPDSEYGWIEEDNG